MAKQVRLTPEAIASKGLPQIPDQLLSTYEMSVEEIISTGFNRLIVFEGAKEQVNQLTIGLLERMGICIPPWERELNQFPRQWTLHDDEDWGEDDEDDWGEDDEDDWGGSTPIPIPRRPSPKPSNDDVAELPPIEYQPPTQA